MLTNRYVKWGGIFGLLILANIANYLWWNWGLVTVNVTDAPLSKVIGSIEWQAWVKIYTNLPADSKVSMFVDHVPLAEAMETLAANVDRPPGDPNRPRGDRPRRQDGGEAGAAAPRPGGDAPPGGDLGGGPQRPGGDAPPGGDLGGGPPRQGGDRPPGGGGGGFGGGGFGGGGGAQWNLAFFVGPTSADVKAEIRDFQSNTTSDGQKIYTYPTPLQMLASGPEMSAADPRLQAWPGIKPVDPAATPPADPPQDATATDNGNTPAPDAPPTVQTYLQALAEGSNIWIMAPDTWAPEVAKPPPENPSIISAVKNLVSGSRGYVTQAIILRAGFGGRFRGGGPGGFDREMDSAFDRMRNAIQGLPPDERADALTNLQGEMDFRKQVQAAPPEKRRAMFRQHMMEKMLYSDRFSRLSPTKRAQMYQRMVAARQAAKGQK